MSTAATATLTAAPPWERGFRVAAARMPTTGLEALARQLRYGGDDLIFGETVLGETEHCLPTERVQAACPLAYPFWAAGLTTCGEVCTTWSQLLDEAGEEACRFVVLWDRGRITDDDLLDLVERLLVERGCANAQA